MTALPSVLVLGGGPDDERPVSLKSAAAVAAALREAGHEVHAETIDRLDEHALAALPGEVVFPVLHGSWGEGGPLQDVLDASARPYVGCGPRAARVAMDKLATKMAAARAGVRTAPSAVFNPADAGCPLPLPVVVKPVHEGSSVGLMLCRDETAWHAAHARVASGEFGRRVFMVESLIAGRELTVGLLARNGRALEPLPAIEIRPTQGVYDYEAKYTRGDTTYLVAPELPAGVGDEIARSAVTLADAIGVRDLARVDFLLDESGDAWLLEINTMPGFTTTSLLPKAAAHAGLPLPALTSLLALRAKNRER